MDAQSVKETLSRIEDIIDWWEYDGSPSEGNRLIEELSKSLPDLRHELQQCPKCQKSQCQ
jgi:hypothetical protein